MLRLGLRAIKSIAHGNSRAIALWLPPTICPVPPLSPQIRSSKHHLSHGGPLCAPRHRRSSLESLRPPDPDSITRSSPIVEKMQIESPLSLEITNLRLPSRSISRGKTCDCDIRTFPRILTTTRVARHLPPVCECDARKNRVSHSSPPSLRSPNPNHAAPSTDPAAASRCRLRTTARARAATGG